MSANFLDLSDDDIFKKLVLDGGSEISELKTGLESDKIENERISIKPIPLFCAKTKYENKREKVFINFCNSTAIPAPKTISEEELMIILESDSPSSYKIPMSISEVHPETDKSGVRCDAYDIVINEEFSARILTSELFKTFLITLSIEALDEKYRCAIKKDWIILKNKKYHGTMPSHFVRGKQKVLIEDLSKSAEDDIHPTERLAPEPDYFLEKHTGLGEPDYIAATIHIPGISKTSNIDLDLGEDRILLDVRPEKYYLDIFIPYYINQAKSEAGYNIKTKTLKLKLPITGVYSSA